MPDAEPVAPEPNLERSHRLRRILPRVIAVVAVLLIAGSIALYFAVRAPTDTLNGFLGDLRARRDAKAWTTLCAADQRQMSQAEFVAAWRRQRAKYQANIDDIDAFTYEPFGSVRRFHYRLSFVDDKVQANTYPVHVVREGGHWKVCGFFSLSRNPDKAGLLSGFENW